MELVQITQNRNKLVKRINTNMKCIIAYISKKPLSHKESYKQIII